LETITGGFGLDNQLEQGSFFNGMRWKLVGLSVFAIAVLELCAAVFAKYPIATSLPLGLFIVGYIVVPRVKEYRYKNVFIGVIASFIIGVILELYIPGKTLYKSTAGLLEFNLFYLLLGLVWSYVFIRLTTWSERKRLESDGKRAKTQTTITPPAVRHHSKKRGKKR